MSAGSRTSQRYRGFTQVKLPDDGCDSSRGEVTLAARVTGRRGLSLPESFGVDAVEAGIRGLAHTAGEPVVVVLVAASGTFFRHHLSRFCR